MESVKLFALSACISIVIGSIISMLVPNIEKTRIFKAVISAFIIAGLIAPLSSIISKGDILNLSDNVAAVEYSNYAYDKSTVENIEDNASITLYPIIKEHLASLGVEQEFGINLNITQEKDGMKIEAVNISIWDLHSIKKEDLINQLSEKTGLPIHIVVNESEEE